MVMRVADIVRVCAGLPHAAAHQRQHVIVGEADAYCPCARSTV